MDLQKELKVIDASILELGTDFKEVAKNTDAFASGIENLYKSLKSTDKLAVKASTSVKAIGTSAVGASFGVLSLLDVMSKVQAITAIAFAADKAFRDLNGTARAFSLEKAIQGTSQLSDNFRVLEASSGTFLDNIVTTFGAAVQSADYQKISSRAIKAYADVEQAAYRLGTITVSSNRRAIDTISENIKLTRELQKATDNVTDSVSTLNAQYDIASAGFTSKADNLSVGKASINLSQAGFGDLGGSTNATVKVLRALGDDASFAEKRASQLFETTKVGLLTLDQLTSVIGPLSVQSKQLGIDFSEITATLAGLTTQGVSASEGATRLEALFAEITNASAETNAQLAAFRDEAGKPIQLNAAVLKDKGVSGIIQDLKTATGGDVSRIQKLFSTKEAVEAVQLLLSLGEDSLKEYTKRIDQVDPSSLAAEASNRTKTVSGSFSAAQNKSQKQVEDFGKGLSVEVIDSVAKTNKVFDIFATGAAESIGNVSGTISGLSAKVQAVGSVFTTAFSTLAPVAFGVVVLKAVTAISSKVEKLKAAFQEQQKEGETVWDTFKRKALDSLATIYARAEQLFERIKKQAKETGAELDLAFNGRKDKQLSLDLGVDSVPSKKNTETLVPDKSDTRPVTGTKAVQLDLFNPSPTVSDNNKSNKAKFSNDKAFSNPFATLADSKSNKSNNLFKKFNDALGGVSEAASKTTKRVQFLANTTGNVLSKGMDVATPFIGKMATYMKGLALGGTAVVAGFTILSANFSNLAQLLDKRTNPALQATRENLLDLKNVDGLKEILDDLDPLTAKLDDASFSAGFLNLSLQQASKYWNDVTGASRVYFNQTKPELDKISEALASNNAEILKNAKLGILGTKTTEGKRAEEKIKLGITLNSDDEQALKDEVKQAQTALQREVTVAEQDLAASKGKVKPIEFEEKQDAVKRLKKEKDEQSKLLEVELQRKLVQQSIAAFNAVDTTIPIRIQLQDNAEQGIQAQINEIASVLNTPDVDILGDPQKYSDQFASLQNRLKSTLDSIGLNINVDVSSSQDLRAELLKTIGADNFAKFVASNPQFRQQFVELNTAISEEITKQTQNSVSASTAAFSTLSSLGSTSGQVVSLKANLELDGIDIQVKALTEELSRPETTLARQKELIAQIEQLEANRLALSVDKKVAEELSGKKAVLSVQEQLLSVQQAQLALFNQESKFGSLAVTAAQARLDAAKQELALKKSQIELTNKEELLKKGAITAGFNDRVAREKTQKQALTGLEGKSAPLANQAVDASITKLKEDLQQKIDVTNKDAANKKEELAKNKGVFTKEDQALIANAFIQANKDNYNRPGDGVNGLINGPFSGKRNARVAQEELFDDKGRLRDEAKVKEALAKYQSLQGNVALTADTKAAAGKAREAIDNNKLKSPLTEGSIDAQKNKDIEQLKQQTQKEIETKQRQNAKLQKLASESTFSNDAAKAIQTPKADTKEAKGTTVNDEEATAKLIAALQAELGSTAESLKLLDAVIASEYASREKLIKQNELVAQSLQAIASNTVLFGDSLAGLSLENIGFNLTNNEQTINTSADKEISRIDGTVKTLQEQVTNTEAVLSAAKASGASSDIVQQIEVKLSSDKALAEKASTESTADKTFVNQQRQLELLGLSASKTAKAIEYEQQKRLQGIEAATKLSDAFGKLSGATLLQNSAASDSLKIFAAQKEASTNRGAVDAANTISAIQARLKVLQNLAKEDTQAGKQAKALLPAATKEAEIQINTAKVEGSLTDISAKLDAASAVVEAEYAAKDRLVTANSGLADSFSQLASSVGSLFSNSSLGATLNTLASDISNSSGKLRAEYDKQVSIINNRGKALDDAIAKAKEDNAPPEVIGQLEKAKSANDAQKQTELAYLDQKLVLDTLNTKLGKMASKVAEVTDTLNKQASLYKDQIDLQQRYIDSQDLNNTSGQDLQSSFLDFLGQNNSASDILKQRLDFNKTEKASTVEKARNVNDAKKQTIDLTVLKAQLDLEQQSYENAISQTALLGDILRVSQGQTPLLSANQQIQDQLSQLPSLISESQQQAKQRSSLVDEQLAFIPKELEVKNQAVDRKTLASQLGALGGNLNPANFDLIQKTLLSTQAQLQQFRPDEIKVGSLNDSGFQRQLDSLRDASNSLRTNIPNQTAQSKPNISSLSLNTPVTISLDLSGSKGINKGEVEQLIRRTAVPALNKSLEKLSKDVVAYASKF